MVFIKKQNGIDEKNGIDGKIWYLRNKGIYEKTYIWKMVFMKKWSLEKGINEIKVFMKKNFVYTHS